jgi:nitroreductase
MEYDTSPLTLIRKRFSCRTYQEKPIDPEKRSRLEDFIRDLPAGPLGTEPRFQWIAAQQGDADRLQGLGTYGFIKNPRGFVIGATGESREQLVDFGYLMEAVILRATDLELGTCWLGGTFNRSRFAAEIQVKQEEIIPAVVSVGLIGEKPRFFADSIRKAADSDRRKPWQALFFSEKWASPLSPEEAGAYARPLEMVRLGPSASNKQPWRVVRQGPAFHFYLKRTPGYPGAIFKHLLRLADLQLADLGIALCHFTLAAESEQLPGEWRQEEPRLAVPEGEIEYIATWVSR